MGAIYARGGSLARGGPGESGALPGTSRARGAGPPQGLPTLVATQAHRSSLFLPSHAWLLAMASVA